MPDVRTHIVLCGLRAGRRPSAPGPPSRPARSALVLGGRVDSIGEGDAAAASSRRCVTFLARFASGIVRAFFTHPTAERALRLRR
jgi:hypothetical protein